MSGWPINYRVLEQLYQHPTSQVAKSTKYRIKPKIINLNMMWKSPKGDFNGIGSPLINGSPKTRKCVHPKRMLYIQASLERWPAQANYLCCQSNVQMNIVT